MKANDKMAKLIISCDEKWPVFNLEVPEEGQTHNCEIPQDVHKEYLFVCKTYSLMQNILKVYYESSKRKYPELPCRRDFSEGSESCSEYEE